MGREIEEMLERCAMVDGAALGESTFGRGPAVFVGKREVAHLDDAAVIDIRLTKAEIRERREELRADPRVELRRSGSDWLEFSVCSLDDIVRAETLLAAAIEANRPSAPPGVPPTGAELDRRRRFH